MPRTPPADLSAIQHPTCILKSERQHPKLSFTQMAGMPRLRRRLFKAAMRVATSTAYFKLFGTSGMAGNANPPDHRFGTMIFPD